MHKKLKNIEINALIVSILSFVFVSLYAGNSFGFLTDEIAASVGSTPITLNELYFLYNLSSINNLKYHKINKTLSASDLKHTLNIYINRLLILKQEEKTVALSLSGKQVDSSIADLKKKFKILHKHADFNAFLAKFGFNEKTFYVFEKNILLEKMFINERLNFFLFILKNNGRIAGKSKRKYSRELSLKLKNLLLNLKKHAEIEINDNFN